MYTSDRLDNYLFLLRISVLDWTVWQTVFQRSHDAIVKLLTKRRKLKIRMVSTGKISPSRNATLLGERNPLPKNETLRDREMARTGLFT